METADQPKRSIDFSTVLLIVVLLAATFAYVMKRNAETAGHSARLLAVGAEAPVIGVSGWLNGQGPKPSDLKGKVTVVDGWAYWCGPCRAKMPELIQLHDSLKNPDVVFLGLTSEERDGVADTQKAIDELKMPWPTGWGASASMRKFKMDRIPCVYVIGRDGKIAWNQLEEANGVSLEQGVAAALAAK